MTSRAMNSLFLPPQGIEGDGDGGVGGSMLDDNCDGATACAFCAGGTGEERAGVLLIGVAGKPGPLEGDTANWGVIRTAGGDCSTEPCGDDSTPGPITYAGK